NCCPQPFHFCPRSSHLRGMPDRGADRCDGHHEVVDSKFQPIEKAPAIDGPGQASHHFWLGPIWQTVRRGWESARRCYLSHILGPNTPLSRITTALGLVYLAKDLLIETTHAPLLVRNIDHDYAGSGLARLYETARRQFRTRQTSATILEFTKGERRNDA